MKFTIDQPDMERLLVTVTRASEARPLLPILGNVLLQADEFLYATGTNVELTITSSVTYQCEDTGSVTLPARELLALVSSLDKSKQITFALDEATVTMHIKSGKSKFQLRGIGADNFPAITEFDSIQECLIPREQLVEGLDRTLYACDPNASNLMHRGQAFVFSNGGLRLYAGTGFRLAEYSISVPELESELELIIPMRSLLEVRNVFSRSMVENINVVIASDHDGRARMIHFDGDDTSVSSQIIDGVMAKDLKTFLPKPSTSVEVSVDQLRTALKRLSIFSIDSNNSVKIGFDEGALTLSSQSQERGNGEDEIEAQFEGNAFTALYNIRHVLDALDSFSGSEKVSLYGRNMGIATALTMENQNFPNLIAVMSPMASSQ